MRDNRNIRNIALTAVVGLALAGCIVTRAFAPVAVVTGADADSGATSWGG